MSLPSLTLGLENSHVLITGSSGHIGHVTTLHFLAAGAKVTGADQRPIHPSIAALSHPNYNHILIDISSESSVHTAFSAAKTKFGPVQTCIALASIDFSFLPHHESLVDMSLEQWRRTFEINVQGTFLTAREWLRGVKEDVAALQGLDNVGLVIVGSESGIFGERGNADYSAGKSAVQGGLMGAMVADVSRIHPRARVNAIAPGPVDTDQFKKECAENPEQLWLDAQATTALRVPVPIEAVAKGMLFLSSSAWSGNISGQVLRVDSGKVGKVLWPEKD